LQLPQRADADFLSHNVAEVSGRGLIFFRAAPLALQGRVQAGLWHPGERMGKLTRDSFPMTSDVPSFVV
jgi:hypothetical protein